MGNKVKRFPGTGKRTGTAAKVGGGSGTELVLQSQKGSWGRGNNVKKPKELRHALSERRSHEKNVGKGVKIQTQ